MSPLFFIAILIFGGFSEPVLYSQDTQRLEELFSPELLELLSEGLLRFYIEARVLDQNRVILWNVVLNEVTIPGRPVNIRLNGENVNLDAFFTPFRHNNDRIILFVQADTWLKNRESKKNSYQTSTRSIPINGETPVIFYPLGIDPRNGSTVNLEIEILVQQVTAPSIANPEVDSNGK